MRFASHDGENDDDHSSSDDGDHNAFRETTRQESFGSKNSATSYEEAEDINSDVESLDDAFPSTNKKPLAGRTSRGKTTRKIATKREIMVNQKTDSDSTFDHGSTDENETYDSDDSAPGSVEHPVSQHSFASRHRHDSASSSESSVPGNGSATFLNDSDSFVTEHGGDDSGSCHLATMIEEDAMEEGRRRPSRGSSGEFEDLTINSDEEKRLCDENYNGDILSPEEKDDEGNSRMSSCADSRSTFDEEEPFVSASDRSSSSSSSSGSSRRYDDRNGRDEDSYEERSISDYDGSKGDSRVEMDARRQRNMKITLVAVIISWCTVGILVGGLVVKFLL